VLDGLMLLQKKISEEHPLSRPTSPLIVQKSL